MQRQTACCVDRVRTQRTKKRQSAPSATRASTRWRSSRQAPRPVFPALRASIWRRRATITRQTASCVDRARTQRPKQRPSAPSAPRARSRLLWAPLPTTPAPTVLQGNRLRQDRRRARPVKPERLLLAQAFPCASPVLGTHFQTALVCSVATTARWIIAE